MFEYVRSRNRSLVFFLISLAVFLPALVLPRSGEDQTVRKMMLFLSLGALLISAVWLLVRWDEVKRLQRLRSGEGILARWTIDRARWEWFRWHSNEWDKREGVQPNNADFRQEPGAAGIEVRKPAGVFLSCHGASATSGFRTPRPVRRRTRR